jgi:hypothetical protein
MEKKNRSSDTAAREKVGVRLGHHGRRGEFGALGRRGRRISTFGDASWSSSARNGIVTPSPANESTGGSLSQTHTLAVWGQLFLFQQLCTRADDDDRHTKSAREPWR